MSTRKILLVDDSRSARYALRLLLKKNDLEVDTADSAETALEMVKESLPDAIFMDHLMPGMNGFEALEALKEDVRTKHIPVVMCTSNDEEPYQIQAREKGALGILPKPADQDKLNDILGLIDAAIAKTETAVAEPAPPLEEPAAAMDQGAVTALVQETLGGLLKTHIEPILDDKLEKRLKSLEKDLGERLQSVSAKRLAEWSEAESTRLREQVLGADNSESLTSKLEQDIKELRAELVKMEANHAQAVVQKLSNEVLPGLVRSEFAALEQQLRERLESQLKDFSDRLVVELPQDPRLLRQISETAETSAEHKAGEIAKSYAQQAAQDSADEKTGELTDYLMSTAEDANKRMYLLAGAAAAIGVLSSLAVYILAV